MNNIQRIREFPPKDVLNVDSFLWLFRAEADIVKKRKFPDSVSKLMKETLQVINQMRADGVIGLYAIGGAVAATFYLEPLATVDIDIFVSFRQIPEDSLISLSPIYEYLQARGHKTRGEYIIIGGWPVQFLTPGHPLGEEALAEAVETEVEAVPTRVMTAEHLTAIALQLGRAKDHVRVLQFVESGVLNSGRFQSILNRHSLQGKWELFQRKFLEDRL